MSSARSASDGIVCTMPVTAEDERREPPPAARDDAERDADEDARRERREDELEVAHQVGEDGPRHRRPDAVAARGASAPSEASSRAAAASRVVPPSVSAAFARAIVGAVDPSDEALHRGEGGGSARLEIEAVDDDGLVARKEVQVVVEQAQGEAVDLGIGGVRVDDVRAPRGERLEGEVVVDAAHVGEVEAVARAKPRPSVGAAEELVAEAPRAARGAGRGPRCVRSPQRDPRRRATTASAYESSKPSESVIPSPSRARAARSSSFVAAGAWTRTSRSVPVYSG